MKFEKGFWNAVKVDFNRLEIIVPKRRDITREYKDGEDNPITFDRANYTSYSMVSKNTVEYNLKERMIHDIEDKLQELSLLKETVRAFLKKEASYADLKEAVK